MTFLIRMTLGMLAISAAVTAMPTTASAWGCIAESDQGSNGYSTQYSDEDGARERALNECANRTGENHVCEITECNEDW